MKDDLIDDDNKLHIDIEYESITLFNTPMSL